MSAESIEHEAMYINVPCVVDNEEKFIQVAIRDGQDNVRMTINEKVYFIDKSQFIRLGKLVKPLTYVEEESAWGKRTRRYE
jgi:hypothetical protein